MKSYSYIGPESILFRVSSQYSGVTIHNINDLSKWISAKKYDKNEQIIIAYVIDISGKLVVCDRHFEHVQCARSGRVLAAGEIVVQFNNSHPIITGITNQSIGYCPKPESWSAVKQALESIEIEYPDYFTKVCHFRKCENCGEISIIKDDYYICENCNQQLSREWNIE
jgi:hypothetical protein